MRLALAISFVLLCVLDNIFTYKITKFPHFQELGPVAFVFIDIA